MRRVCEKLGTSVFVFALGAGSIAAWAQTFPDKPVRLVVPFAVGGAADLVPRIALQKLGDHWGQHLVIDNRPGAAGNIGSVLVANAPADGYTLLLAAIAHAVNPSLYKKIPYDLIKDFAPVTMLASTPSVVMLNMAVSANSVTELIALAKAKPGQLNYGSQGNGTSSHLATVLFCSMAGIEMTHVQYKAAPTALVDLLAGRIEFYINTLPSAMPHVRAKKLKVLAVTSLNRTVLLPDLATVSESGIPGYEMTSWYGVLARIGTPRSIVDKLNADMVQAIRVPEVTEKLPSTYPQAVTMFTEEMPWFSASDLEWIMGRGLSQWLDWKL
jgi:tripartite-type tricarboxylate transporter receptor subunit TctC